MSFVDGVKESLGLGIEENPFGIPYSQRLFLFIVGNAVGFVLMFLSYFFILPSPSTFAFLYTLGNVFPILGSVLFKGLKAQYEMMFHKSRRIASLVYLTTLVLVIVALAKGANGLIVLFLAILQMLAMFYYTLSFVPFVFNWVNGMLANSF